jgi:hypothetical protein
MCRELYISNPEKGQFKESQFSIPLYFLAIISSFFSKIVRRVTLISSFIKIITH